MPTSVGGLSGKWKFPARMISCKTSSRSWVPEHTAQVAPYNIASSPPRASEKSNWTHICQRTVFRVLYSQKAWCFFANFTLRSSTKFLLRFAIIQSLLASTRVMVPGLGSDKSDGIRWGSLRSVHSLVGISLNPRCFESGTLFQNWRQAPRDSDLGTYSQRFW